MPEEELRLDVFASYDDDDLERLEDDLENVDDAIAASGKGNREVNIDVDTDAIIAAGELEALDEVIESVDDDVEIDVETDTEDIPEEFADATDFEGDSIEDKFDNVTENALGVFDDDVGVSLETNTDGVSESNDEETETPSAALFDEVVDKDTDDESDSNDKDIGDRFDNATDDLQRAIENLEIDVETNQNDISDADSVSDTDSTATEDMSLGLDGILEEMLDSDGSDSSSGGSEDTPSGDGADALSPTRRENAGIVAEGQDPFEASTLARDRLDAINEQREIGDDSISIDDIPDMISRDSDRRSGVLNRAKNQFSDTISGATDGIKNFQFTIAAFNQVLVSVFPALLSFVGAIPAAIVALGGLAAAAITAMAALGAVGVLGLGGMALQGNGELDIQPIMNRLQGIFDAFITAFTPLMKTFVAPVKNAFNTIEALADPLAQAASGLTAFQSLFNDTLATVAQGLPSFTAKLVAFGQAAIPILRGFIQFVNNTDFIGFFAEQLQRASLSILMIIESVKQILPFIINLSQGFLFVASAILTLIGGLAFIFNFFPRLTGVIGAVIGALLLLVTVTTLYSIVTASSAVKAGFALAGSLLKSAGAAIIAKFGMIGLTLAVVALTSAITLGLAGVFSFSGAFDDLTGSIMGANSSLREFNKLTGRSSFSSGFSGPGNPIGQTGGQGSNYDVSVVSDGDKDRAARSAYTSSYELKQREQTNSIFGS